MHIILNHSSMVPIYEQLMEQIKSEIINTALKEGEALPSVRSLAGELRISALTVKKAYDKLEEEGFVTTITNAADITSIQWQITSGGETRETKVFTNIPTAEVTGELKLGIIITGLNDDAATATAIINPKAEEVTE